MRGLGWAGSGADGGVVACWWRAVAFGGLSVRASGGLVARLRRGKKRERPHYAATSGAAAWRPEAGRKG